MLDGLRKYATGWAAQLLMGLLVLSFAAWGVNDVFNGFRSNDVAMVGSTPITLTDYQRTYELAMTDLAQRLGQQLTPDQARQFGVPNQVLRQLVNQATLDNTANKMGLGISNAQLTKAIGADKRFSNNTGAFDRNILTQVVRQMGYTPDDYIVDQRKALERGQLAQAFAGGISAPTAYLEAVHDYTLEERDISYFVLTAPPATDVADPSDSNLTAYFDKHKDEWKAPELRAVAYFVLSPADVADVSGVSDADAQKAYDAQPARFAQAEKRKVDQIVFKDRADADQAAAALAGGKTFDALITERNLKPADVDLGLVTKDKIVDPAIADAAFAAALNVPSPVVEGQFGPAILRVTEIDPPVTTTFDQAKADLKTEIAAQRAATEVTATRDSIEDARAAGGTSAEIAAKYGLKMVTVAAVDSAGKDADGNAIPDLPAGLVDGVFQSDVGNDNDPIQPAANSFLWYDVTAVTAPHDRALADVRDKVVAAWKDSERLQRLDTKAAAAKQRLENKDDIATVATELGVTVKTVPKLTRTAKATDDLSTAAISASFGGPKGSVALADGVAPMTRLVLRVDTVTVPEFNPAALDLANTKRTLDGQFVNAFLSLYVGQVQAATNVTFNQVALQQVLGGTTTN